MITQSDYFAKKEESPEVTEGARSAAAELLRKVNALLAEAEQEGAYEPLRDADTGSQISGAKGGSGDGGFRLQGSSTGAARSAHKLARAVDVFDPQNRLDEWLDRFELSQGMNSVLEVYMLYREAPGATPGWCHLQDIAPGSGRRTFFP